MNYIYILNMDLPIELQYHIFDYLEDTDLLNLAITNKLMRDNLYMYKELYNHKITENYMNLIERLFMLHNDKYYFNKYSNICFTLNEELYDILLNREVFKDCYCITECRDNDNDTIISYDKLHLNNTSIYLHITKNISIIKVNITNNISNLIMNIIIIVYNIKLNTKINLRYLLNYKKSGILPSYIFKDIT